MTSQLIVYPQTAPLRGTITIPGDKSISHRAVMLAAIAEGVSQIRNWLPAGDTLATLHAVQAMGVPVHIQKRSPQSWDLTIEGQGLRGLRQPEKPLDCRNAGTCMRLLAGILAGQSFSVVLDGSEQLRRRPMGRVVTPLRAMGAEIESENGRAPLHISPATLQSIHYKMPVASAQVKSAVLLAGLYASGETRIVEPGPARDHTERMLTAMGVPVRVEGNEVILPAATERRLRPLDLTVPGDISSAAFVLVAAAIVPYSEVRVTNVGFNPTRTGIVEMLRAMGAQIVVENERVTGGETAVDLIVRFSELHAVDVAGELVVRGIDECPIWTVAATQAAGTSRLRDAAELRVKEVDRIGVLAGELQKLGVPVVEYDDGLAVTGPLQLSGGVVNSHDDHRLGMSLAVAGLVAQGETCVLDAGCVADSFPGFVETMQILGARMSWLEGEG
ncbi:MAG: 3-phosphoshikimate 1-carboxyvinyltransferase [Chloroflexi bacterium]|nr:MAG: 3-phosphoshikimate 1-carboxyvinyltransferase [Chloroflexota bacterium]